MEEEAQKKLSDLLITLKEIRNGIRGTIDGHSWGEEETGVSKVSIEDLEEIKKELDEIIEEFSSDDKDT